MLTAIAVGAGSVAGVANIVVTLPDASVLKTQPSLIGGILPLRTQSWYVLSRRQRRQIRSGQQKTARAAPQGARRRLRRHCLSLQIHMRDVGRGDHRQLALRVRRDEPGLGGQPLARLHLQDCGAKFLLERLHASAQLGRIRTQGHRQRKRRRRREPRNKRSRSGDRGTRRGRRHRRRRDGRQDALPNCGGRIDRLGRPRQRVDGRLQGARLGRALVAHGKMRPHLGLLGRRERAKHECTKLAAQFFVVRVRHHRARPAARGISGPR